MLRQTCKFYLCSPFFDLSFLCSKFLHKKESKQISYPFPKAAAPTAYRNNMTTTWQQRKKRHSDFFLFEHVTSDTSDELLAFMKRHWCFLAVALCHLVSNSSKKGQITSFFNYTFANGDILYYYFQ
jgi:hypothetical protein